MQKAVVIAHEIFAKSEERPRVIAGVRGMVNDSGVVSLPGFGGARGRHARPLIRCSVLACLSE